MFLHQERTAWRKRAEVAHRHVGQWKVDGTIMPAKNIIDCYETGPIT